MNKIKITVKTRKTRTKEEYREHMAGLFIETATGINDTKEARKHITNYLEFYEKDLKAENYNGDKNVDYRADSEKVIEVMEDKNISLEAKMRVLENYSGGKTLEDLTDEFIKRQKDKARSKTVHDYIKEVRSDAKNAHKDDLIELLQEMLFINEEKMENINLQTIDISDIIKELNTKD